MCGAFFFLSGQGARAGTKLALLWLIFCLWLKTGFAYVLSADFCILMPPKTPRPFSFTGRNQQQLFLPEEIFVMQAAVSCGGKLMVMMPLNRIHTSSPGQKRCGCGVFTTASCPVQWSHTSSVFSRTSLTVAFIVFVKCFSPPSLLALSHPMFRRPDT